MKKDCVFCHFKDEAVVIYKDKLCYAVISKNPINQHHVLIIPITHYKEFTDVPSNIAAHLFKICQKLSLALRAASKPAAISYVFDDDFSNTGLNLVSHFKIHIIPRFKEDLSAIDWGKLRADKSIEERSTYAKELKKFLL